MRLLPKIAKITKMPRMRGYKPATPFSVAMKLLAPTATNVRGARVNEYPKPDDVTGVFFGSFRTFGGTERIYNDVYAIEDTATIDTWYDPAIKADCRIYVCQTGKTYEIMGTPENIEMRNQFLAIKVRAIGGGA